jgi:hypothetical protein
MPPSTTPLASPATSIRFIAVLTTTLITAADVDRCNVLSTAREASSGFGHAIGWSA